MKIHFDIDLTPEEARRLFGLPDMEPLHKAVMADLEERLKKNMARLEPEALVRSWFEFGPKGLEQLQNLFGGLAGMAGRTGRPPKDKG